LYLIFNPSLLHGDQFCCSSAADFANAFYTLPATFLILASVAYSLKQERLSVHVCLFDCLSFCQQDYLKSSEGKLIFFPVVLRGSRTSLTRFSIICIQKIGVNCDYYFVFSRWQRYFRQKIESSGSFLLFILLFISVGIGDFVLCVLFLFNTAALSTTTAPPESAGQSNTAL